MRTAKVLVQLVSIFLLIFGVASAQVVRQPGTRTSEDTSLRQSPTITSAIVPRLMRFSGSLRDTEGKPRIGTVDLTFSLYSTEIGGDPLWFETQTVQTDNLGRYTTLLGAMHMDGLPMELFASGQAQWLGIQVGNNSEQQPRVLLVSVPYALKAGDAETLGGRPASAYVLADTIGTSGSASRSIAATKGLGTTGEKEQNSRKANASTLTGCSAVTSSATATVNILAKFTPTACNVENSAIMETSGNVGIGMTPGVALDITSATNAGLRLSGAGTHQVTVTGATSGRLGQDALGFFFSSDSIGASIRFGTNNGTNHEWMRITSSGNIGIGTAAPSTSLDVAGNIKSSGTVTAASFAGSGAGLTILPASSLAGGIAVGGSGTGGLSVSLNATSPNINNGFSGNSVSGGVVGATISGGGASGFVNSITANYGTLAGGIANLASGSEAAVGGGQGNTASGSWAVVGGGANNTASGSFATVLGGGTNNTSFANNSTIGGGSNNLTGDSGLTDHTIGANSAVGGGKTNTASGSYSTVPGGEGNTTGSSADHSFAAGFGAVANHTGTFVWADNVGAGSKTTFTSTGNNQFLIRANGGVGIGTASPQATLDVAGQDRRKPVAFSSLTACSSTIEGETAAVNDSTTNTWGATVSGGGALHVLAYCDGANWTVAAK